MSLPQLMHPGVTKTVLLVRAEEVKDGVDRQRVRQVCPMQRRRAFTVRRRVPMAARGAMQIARFCLSRRSCFLNGSQILPVRARSSVNQLLLVKRCIDSSEGTCIAS